MKAGGHPQACGLSIEEKNLDIFRERVTMFAKDYFNGDAPPAELRIDTVLPLEKIDWDVYGELSKLKPFGEGNPRPVFIARNLTLISAVTMGKTNTHLRLTTKDNNGKAWKAVGFSFGEWAEKLSSGDRIDIVYEIDINEWNGRRDLQVRIIDLKKAI